MGQHWRGQFGDKRLYQDRGEPATEQWRSPDLRRQMNRNSKRLIGILVAISVAAMLWAAIIGIGIAGS